MPECLEPGLSSPQLLLVGCCTSRKSLDLPLNHIPEMLSPSEPKIKLLTHAQKAHLPGALPVLPRSSPVTNDSRDDQLYLVSGLWIPFQISEMQILPQLALIASVTFSFECLGVDMISNAQKSCAVIKSHPHPFVQTFPCMCYTNMLISMLLQACRPV